MLKAILIYWPTLPPILNAILSQVPTVTSCKHKERHEEETVNRFREASYPNEGGEGGTELPLIIWIWGHES